MTTKAKRKPKNGKAINACLFGSRQGVHGKGRERGVSSKYIRALRAPFSSTLILHSLAHSWHIQQQERINSYQNKIVEASAPVYQAGDGLETAEKAPYPPFSIPREYTYPSPHTIFTSGAAAPPRKEAHGITNSTIALPVRSKPH